MTVLQIPIALWDDAKAKDPDAVAELATWWRKHLGSAGQVGGTYDADGNLTSPHTHYVWGDNVLLDLDLLYELTEALQDITLAAPVAQPDRERQTPEKRKAERVETRKRLRITERRAARVATRQAMRTAARQAYRTAARAAERRAERRGETFTAWPEWEAADEQTQDLYLLQAYNDHGNPDVKIV